MLAMTDDFFRVGKGSHSPSQKSWVDAHFPLPRKVVVYFFLSVLGRGGLHMGL